MTLKSLPITAFLCFSELNGDLERIKLVYTLTIHLHLYEQVRFVGLEVYIILRSEVK